MGEEVDPRVLALLREPRTAPAGARDRVRARLALVVPGMGQGGTGHGGGTGNGAGAPHAGGSLGSGRWLAGLAKPVAIVTAFTAGGAGGFALHAAITRPAPPTVVYVDRVVSAPAPVPLPSSPPAPAPSATPQPTAAATMSTSQTPPAPSGASQLAAERLLLDQARAALIAGEPDRAILSLEQHQHRFLNPLLGEERDAMRIEALAQAGRMDEARTRASAFRRTYPTSLFLSTVDSAVGTNP